MKDYKELPVGLQDSINQAVREGVKQVLRESLSDSDFSIREEMEMGLDDDDSSFEYSPPITAVFRANSMDLLSSGLNDWVRETGNDIVNMAVVRDTDDTLEAMVIYYADEDRFNPPPGWLEGGLSDN